jgi:hypothetical protein
MRASLVILAAIFVSLTGSAFGSIVSGPLVNPANGHSYYLLSPDNWANSQAEAQTLGGNLVTINDEAENIWVYTNFAVDGGLGRNIWTGYYDPSMDSVPGSGHAANFVWVDGETSAYTNWNAGEPNNFDGIQFNAYMMAPHWGKNGAWDDAAGSSTIDNFGAGFYGVVEVPEPATLGSIAVAGLSVLARRRHSSQN